MSLNHNIHETPNGDGTYNLDITCKVCGKPLEVATEYGIFCQDKCGMEDAKVQHNAINKLAKKAADMDLDGFIKEALGGPPSGV